MGRGSTSDVRLPVRTARTVTRWEYAGDGISVALGPDGETLQACALPRRDAPWLLTLTAADGTVKMLTKRSARSIDFVLQTAPVWARPLLQQLENVPRMRVVERTPYAHVWTLEGDPSVRAHVVSLDREHLLTMFPYEPHAGTWWHPRIHLGYRSLRWQCGQPGVMCLLNDEPYKSLQHATVRDWKHDRAAGMLSLGVPDLRIAAFAKRGGQGEAQALTLLVTRGSLERIFELPVIAERRNEADHGCPCRTGESCPHRRLFES